MLHNINSNDLRNYCRQNIESLELWLRRLIDEVLTEKYGNDYFEAKDPNGNAIIKGSIKEDIKRKKEGEPLRYPRLIDAVVLEIQIELICKPHLYPHFKDAFINAFPLGVEETRIFLTRIANARNPLAHANSLSIRQAEQVICYCHDIIDSMKLYYQQKGLNMQYNVPTIIRITDSFGNVFHTNQSNRHSNGSFIHFLYDNSFNLRPGDTLSVEIEVDNSFNRSDYEIIWSFHNQESNFTNDNEKLVLNITEKHVMTEFPVFAHVKSKINSWHRLRDVDDTIGIYYRVLPPLN